MLTDGTRTIELYHMQNFGHHDGMLLVYLPKEKVLLEADGYNPQAATATPPTPPSPYTVSLYDNIQRLKLDVQRVVPVHYPADNRVGDDSRTCEVGEAGPPRRIDDRRTGPAEISGALRRQDDQSADRLTSKRPSPRSPGNCGRGSPLALTARRTILKSPAPARVNARGRHGTRRSTIP